MPFGFVVLWAIAIALWALALWHAIEGLLARRDSSPKKWGVRVSEWGQTLVFLCLGLIAASVALGAKPDADEAAQAAQPRSARDPGRRRSFSGPPGWASRSAASPSS